MGSWHGEGATWHEGAWHGEAATRHGPLNWDFPIGVVISGQAGARHREEGEGFLHNGKKNLATHMLEGIR